MRAAAVLMEILRRSGVRHLFGNPGTTELTFLDALPDSGLEYVVALQEATAVAARGALRRALKLALTPPTGPVFLSLPMDLMAEAVDDSGDAAPVLAARTRPEAAALHRAVEILGAAKAPLVIAGDGVARAGA